VVWQQECDGISSQLLAIWRQHSRSSSVMALSGSKQAMSGDANIESVNSRTASLPIDFIYEECTGRRIANAIAEFSLHSILSMSAGNG